MSVLPEREGGIFRMAQALLHSPKALCHEIRPGFSAVRREEGRFTIDAEYVVSIADVSRPQMDPARWHLRHHLRVTYEGLRVFDAWTGRIVGTKEPNIGLVVDFLPGPWETRLANLWKAEREPS